MNNIIKKILLAQKYQPLVTRSVFYPFFNDKTLDYRFDNQASMDFGDPSVF